MKKGSPASLPEPIRTSGKTQNCAEVNNNLSSLARSGVERVGCFTTESATAFESTVTGAEALPPVWCDSGEKGKYWYKRDGWCMAHVSDYWVVDTRTGKKVGQAQISVRQEINLAASKTSASAEEFVGVTLLSQSGEAKGIKISFSSGCTACNPKEVKPWSGSQSFTVGQTRQLRVDRPVPVTAGGQSWADWGWDMKVTSSAVADPEIYEWGGGIVSVRCDNQVNGNFGCVVTEDIPILWIDYAKRGAAAMMVWYGMRENKNHWADESLGKPLTRLADDAQATANRRIICPDSWPRDPSVPQPTCDEWPFAHSNQSGPKVGVTSGDQCQQLTSVQDSSGDWQIAFIGGRNDNAKCLRATTPSSQNSGVGSDLGNLTKTARILDGDPYWIRVYDSRLPAE